MLIGYPASGKSTYSLELAKETNSIILNRDTIGGLLKDLVKLIDKDNNYILDNTNLSIKTRKGKIWQKGYDSLTKTVKVYLGNRLNLT